MWSLKMQMMTEWYDENGTTIVPFVDQVECFKEFSVFEFHILSFES